MLGGIRGGSGTADVTTLGRGMTWLLQVGVSWTCSSHHVTCGCPGSTNNTGDTAETTPMPHWDFLFIISFPSASTGQWVLPHGGPAQPQLPPGPTCPWVAGRHSGWFRQLVTQRGLCPPHPWLQPARRVNDYPRPPPALPGHSEPGVISGAQPGLVLGAQLSASALLQLGLPVGCPCARAELPRLPRAGCPLPDP